MYFSTDPKFTQEISGHDLETVRKIEPAIICATTTIYFYFSPLKKTFNQSRQTREEDVAMARAPDCLASHACVPGLNPAVPERAFQRNSIVSPFSM